MCDCKTDIEAELTERFKAQAPKGRDHKVELQGYGLAVVGNTLTVVPLMTFQTFAYMPLAKGGEKPKKTTGNMMFSYCPFCGEKIDKAAQGEGDKA